MKVGLVTGPCPPGECGVGDYTACLSKTLQTKGIDARLIRSGDWSLLGASRVSKSLREQKFDIVHIEHPTVGFGKQLGPQVLSLLQSCVITIHEASQWSVLGRLALIPFSVRPGHIIFTSGFERRFAATWAPWVAGVSSVIPVGSNIEAAAEIPSRASTEIVYFGLIVPREELEQVLKMASLIETAGLPLTIRVIGRVPLKYTAYFDELKQRARRLPIVWNRDLDEEQTAKRLAGASIAYLPYSDGASERRTTLKAALQSGLAVITTKGTHTPREMEGVVKFCQNPEESLAVIRSLVENPDETSAMSVKAVQYGQRFSWEHIAKLHLEVYESVLRMKRGKVKDRSLRTNASKFPSLP